jgi:hypothetical protein
MPEGSRGLSCQRYPRKAFPDIRILEGCQTFCDLSEVVNARVFSGGVGIPLAQDASTFCQPSGLHNKLRLPEIKPRPSMSELNGGCGKSAPPS